MWSYKYISGFQFSIFSSEFHDTLLACICNLPTCLTCFLGSVPGIMVKVLDCDLEVCKVKLELGYYVHFQNYTLEKGVNPLFPQAVG